MRLHNRKGVVRFERPGSRERLVEHDAERVDVRAVIEIGRRLHLLRRHVVRRPHQPTVFELGRIGGDRRKPKVGEFHAALWGDQDVRGRDIAVRDAVVVCVGKGIEGLAAKVQYATYGQWSAGEQLTE